MRPDAAVFLPHNNTSATTNNHDADPRSPIEDAMDSARASLDRFTIDDANQKQSELMTRESIQKILEGMTSVRARCEALETANVELKAEISNVKRGNFASTACHHTPAESSDLTVNASTNKSTNAEPHCSAGIRDVNEDINLVTQVLRKHDAQIETQAALQENSAKRSEDLEKRFGNFEKRFEDFEGRSERHFQDQTDRFTAMEERFQTMQDNMNHYGLDGREGNGGHSFLKSGGLHPDVGQYFQDGMQQCQRRMTDLELKVGDNVESVHELNSKVDVLTIAVQSGAINKAESGSAGR